MYKIYKFASVAKIFGAKMSLSLILKPEISIGVAAPLYSPIVGLYGLYFYLLNSCSESIFTNLPSLFSDFQC